MNDFVPYPLVLAPRYLEKVWGGRRMETVLGRRLPRGAIGEAWEVHDRDGASSVVRNGPLAGRTLADLRGGAPFPLLVKTLDATDTLSVQVHPDAGAAVRLSAEAKTECWFVLHAEPGARVWRGLRDGVTRPELAAALASNDGARIAACLHSFEVASGDTIFVPAGTVHTIGAGVLLAEVQQNSDTTYRLWDWGRPREIHVREGLESVHFGPRSPDKVPAQVIVDEGSIERLLLVKCTHFMVESVTGMGTFTLDAPPPASGVPVVLHVLAGTGEIRPFRRGVAPVAFEPGTTMLLPPSSEEFEVAPGASVVRALLIRG